MPVQVTHNNDGHFYTIDVDLAKEGAEVFDLTTYFKARVADNNVGLRFRWFWQGQFFNTVGKKPRVVGLVGQYSFKKADNGINRELVMSPDASAVAFTGDVNDCEPGGYATYYFPEQMFPQDGMFKGTVGLLDDSGETARYTSVDIWFKVYPQAGGAQMGKACDYYVSELDKTIKEAEEDLKAGQKEQQQILDEYRQKVTDLINQVNGQVADVQTTLTNLRTTIQALEAKAEKDNLFTQAEADAFKQTLESEIADLNKQVTSLEANTPYFKLADYKTGTNSWQDAVDAVLALKTSAYNIALPKDQAVTTDITISKPGVSLIGGVLSGAQLVLDYPSDSNENTMCSVDHVRFTGDNDGIKIIRAPYVRIANCYFGNTGVGIRNASDVNKDGFQPSRRLIITGNHFNGCSYGFYAKDATNTFGSAGDVIFTNNQVDVKIGGIHSENVDGHTITNNVFYMPGNSDRDMDKLDNIYLQNAHFTVIQGNSCFEAGRNGIRLVDCTNISVLDNQIDWPGQNTPGSGIYFEYSLSGEIMGRISGNQIVYPTKYGIETPATNGMLDVSDNMIVAAGDGRYYCGSESLDNYAPHYNVHAPNMNGSKFSGNMAFAVNNNQSQWNVNNAKTTSNYLSDILNYSDRVSVKDFSRNNIVYRAVLHQTLSASYQMTKDDFDTKVGGPDVGAYMIYIIPWSESATAEVYIAAYSGGITTQGSLTKVYGGQSKTQISVDGDTISFTGTGLVVITAI